MNSSCCAFGEPILYAVLPPFIFLEFILGIVGNILALWMVCLEFKSWKPNSVYLLSLTLADFVVLLCVFFRADYYLRNQDWVYGDMPCRLLLFVTSVARASSMLFLSLIALNRFFHILFPFHKVNSITVKQAACICITLWLCLLTIHTYILTSPRFLQLPNATLCESFTICPQAATSWQDIFYLSLCTYSLLTICCSTVSIAKHLKNNAIDLNGKVGRAMRFLIVLAVVFILCYLPGAIIRITIIVLISMKYRDCAEFRGANLGFSFAVCFTYFYSMLNPILYYFSSPSSHKLLANLCRNPLTSSLTVATYSEK
ncbi:hydroxycarboxylic acid receptor 2-like [Hyperolius riggenbachi]|uniref:hydroxycarboxylic acid receptor 2-like n=1 Tax=Hyperolius riggenbachi TaxID=752182 RepID=UPI0035A31BCF